MGLIRTESTRYTRYGSFEEIINKFQDCNIKKYNKQTKNKKKIHKDSWKKQEKLQNNKNSILFDHINN